MDLYTAESLLYLDILEVTKNILKRYAKELL